MTREEVLREACEVAGLDCAPGGPWVSGGRRVDWENPMLPAYVAELLVAQIVKHDPGNKRLREFDWQLHRRAQLSPSTATAWHRILAAMVALGKMTPEQAQEVE